MKRFTTPMSSKRTRIGSVAAGIVLTLAALAGCTSDDAAAADPAGNDQANKPTIVIVHGAWSDASPFDEVGGKLRENGYTVVNFANPLRALGTDTEYLHSFLQTRTDGPVVLVGHSYGGAVIGGAAATDPDVKALVYIDAFVPDTGETILDLAGHAGPVDPSALFDMAQFPGDHNVDLYLKPEPFAGGFANGLSKDQQAEYFAKQRPITYAALSEPAGDQAWKTLPSWYVAGTEDHSIDINTQLWMAERAGSTVTKVKASHLSMVAQPKAVTKVIEEAAGSA
jgi:pimeloyl-ACP methyl ester carboxylesterase